MGSVTKFAAINTKIRALESQLLNDEDYQTLVEKDDLQSVLRYLQQHTVYQNILKGDIKDVTDLSKLERTFKKFVFERYEKLIHYVTDENRRVFKYMFMRYEVENIKGLIRAIYRKENLAEVMDGLLVSKHFSKLDYKMLSNCQTLSQLIDGLSETPYGALLKPYLNESEDQMLFYMEMNLDRLYFKSLVKQMMQLSGEDRAYNLLIIGINIDILNIQWIYRGLKYYHLSSEELFNYCLNNGAFLTLNKIKTLCYIKDDKTFLSEIKETKYGSLFETDDPIDLVMERQMERYLYRQFMELTQKGHLNLITPIAYMHKLEYEMRDLFAIMESKRYGLDADRTKTFLVRHL